MKRFTVSITRRYDYEIEANTLDEAIENGINEYRSDAFHPLADVEFDEIIVNDENDNTIYQG